jgi:membrane-associated phospholipid phosphatase
MGKYPLLRLLYIVPIFIQMMSISFGQQAPKSTQDSSSIIVTISPDSVINVERQVTWHQMFTNIPSDYVELFHYSSGSKYILSLASVGALTGAFLLVDNAGWNFNHSLIKKSPLAHKISDLSIKMGDGRNQFITAALFAIPGIILNDKTAIRTGSNIVESIISTGIFVQLLKRITGRESPAVSTEHGGDWDPFPGIKQYQKNQPSYYSFPSGHLATATAVVTVIANNYPDQKWIRPVGYPLLGLLGFSLVSEGMHWYSDLPLAVLLGYTFGNIIAPERTLPAQGNEKSMLSIFPSITLNGVQLGILYKI